MSIFGGSQSSDRPTLTLLDGIKSILRLRFTHRRGEVDAARGQGRAIHVQHLGCRIRFGIAAPFKPFESDTDEKYEVSEVSIVTEGHEVQIHHNERNRSR